MTVPLLDGIDLADAIQAMQRLGAAAFGGPLGSMTKDSSVLATTHHCSGQAPK